LAIPTFNITLSFMPRLAFSARHHYPSGFVLDASFEMGDGITALFGPSGAGKSTILSIIAGVVRPDFARVQLGERTLIDTKARIELPPERRLVGFVQQDHLLFPHMSVRSNLLYGLKRRPGTNVDFDRLVDVLELREFLDRPPKSLSGGQKQRVSLGRAMLRGPELLLMDEPLTALDAPLKDRILSYFQRAIERWKIPTLVVSHDQSDVRRCADDVVVIESGKVVTTGPTAATLDRAVMGAMHDRPGPVNLIRLENARKVEDHIEATINSQLLRFPGEAPDGQIVHIQFLPRDVLLSRGDVPGISARNHLRGSVTQIVPLSQRVFVAIDVGQTIWAEVTSSAVNELGLQIGASVTCHVKSSAIQVLV
jgi:molybdate transport system ATP-binding protein